MEEIVSKAFTKKYPCLYYQLKKKRKPVNSLFGWNALDRDIITEFGYNVLLIETVYLAKQCMHGRRN